MSKNHVMKFVKIVPNRGYKKGFYKVLSQTASEYRLQNINGGDVFSIYKAHCYEDRETYLEFKNFKLKRASAIG